MSVYWLRDQFVTRANEKLRANRDEMEHGKERDEYMKLVGRNHQLREDIEWFNELLKELDSHKDEDEL